MKILILFIILAGCIDLRLSAQGIGDTTFYNPGIKMIGRAINASDYIRAAGYFEELNGRMADQWLVPYYAALSYIQASYKVEEDKSKDALIDKAQLLIDKGFKLKPDETELLVLQAFLYQSRIQVNPEMRGLTYSRKAEANLKQAAAADDANPRAWSLMGYNIFHTPAVFGGGASKALPVFLKARERFWSFKPSLPFMPVWGEPENQDMIAKCNKSLNQGM
jgi:hypothetical protein